MDKRHPLAVDNRVRLADSYDERDAAQQMVAVVAGERPSTIGADKGYDTKRFVAVMGWRGVIPHVAQNTNRTGGTAMDQRSRRPIRATDNH